VGPAPDITVIVTAPGNSGTVVSTASVSTTTTDFNSANNTATTRTAVIGTGDIAGTVFNDLDGDGIRNAGEPGLAGVTITLRNDANAVIAVTVTAADGSFAFLNLQPGTYTVTETDPPGLVSTTPNSVPVVATAGGTAAVNFGDRLATNAVAVPTMTEWGMILFVVLGGLLAVQRLRRQRALR
jgi:hypothetical protein